MADGSNQASTPTSRPDDRAATSRPTATRVTVSTSTMWRAVGVVLVTLLGIWAVTQARDVATLLILSLFFALALVPGVNHLHDKRGWRRGAAVGVIYLVGLASLVLFSLVFLPLVGHLAQWIADNGTQWLTDLNTWTSDTFGVNIVSDQAAKDAVVTTQEFLSQWSDQLAGAASGAVTTGLSLVFNAATIATFTFYLTADFPRLQRELLSWFRADRQERLGWIIDQSVTQVGGYLYSKLLLTLINGIGFFIVMALVGLPMGLALPLAIFAGFVSEFIPNIGTYIGGAAPVAITLAVQGLVPALIVLAYVLLYQQVENYWLSPRISAETMELNGGVAFGSALVGGALFGAMGAFLALPVAALIFSFIKNYRHSYDVVYTSAYDDSGAAASRAETSGQATATASGDHP